MVILVWYGFSVAENGFGVLIYNSQWIYGFQYTIQASIKIVEDHLECDETCDSESDSNIDVKSNCHVKDALKLPPLMRCSYKKQKTSVWVFPY